MKEEGEGEDNRGEAVLYSFGILEDDGGVWCIPWCFSSGLCQPQCKKEDRIGDGTGRMRSNIIKRGTEELSKSWQTLENEGKFVRESRRRTSHSGKTYETTEQGREERGRFSFASSPCRRLETEAKREGAASDHCQPLLEHRHEPKPREKDWRCLCFVSWQKMILTQTHS